MAGPQFVCRMGELRSVSFRRERITLIQGPTMETTFKSFGACCQSSGQPLEALLSRWLFRHVRDGDSSLDKAPGKRLGLLNPREW